MAAARYWRLVGIEAAGGGDLELSEIALYAGASRIDGSATLTCSHAPLAGSLADLKDGSTSTACRFAAADVRSAGFYLQWDYGTVVDCSEMKLGATASVSMFLHAATLLRGTDAGWVVEASIAGVVFPGSNALTSSESGRMAPTTWNPNDKGTSVVLSRNNLDGFFTNGLDGVVRSVFGASSGKWYWEVTGSSYLETGVATSAAPLMAYPDSSPHAFVLFFDDGRKWHNNTGGAYASAPGPQVVSILLDMDARTLGFWVGGVNKGVAYTLPAEIYYAFAGSGASASATCSVNFGASPFVYAPPTGYKAGFGLGSDKLPVSIAPKPRTRQSRPMTVAGMALGDHRAPAALGAFLACDIEHGGPGTIYGTTKTKGTPNQPAKARVVLLHQRSKLPVRETWSDPITGAFAFTGIDTAQQFLTLAEDAAGNFRPVAASRLVPEVLP